MRQIYLIAIVLGALLTPLPLWPSTAADNVLVVLGLPDKLMADARRFAAEEFSTSFTATVISVEEFSAGPHKGTTDAGLAPSMVIGAGVSGCRTVMQHFDQVPTLCTLLSRQSFENLRTQFPAVQTAALVVDQPVERQITVANNLFPALKRFSVPESSNVDATTLPVSTQSRKFSIDRTEALAPGIASAVARSDALVAVPDKVIFNRETLRTVMLTAYGYGKPIIGYSKAYVRAGALMSTYSDMRQCFKNSAELVGQYLAGETVLNRIHSPRYFSIEVNSSIARSLKLVQRDRDLGRDWQDEDFAS